MEKGGAGFIGAYGRNPLSEQRAFNEILPADGHGDGPADAHVFEERMIHVESEIHIDRGQIAVFVKIFLPPRRIRLAEILLRTQAHEINTPRARLHEHGARVGDNAIDNLVDMGAALKISRAGHKGQAGT